MSSTEANTTGLDQVSVLSVDDTVCPTQLLILLVDRVLGSCQVLPPGREVWR